MNFDGNNMPLSSATEQDEIDRKMVAFVNTWPDCPVDFINYEMLPADKPAMSFSTTPGSYISTRYITGGYLAEYQFKLVYRMKSGNKNDKRLSADETLNAFGDWCMTQTPHIGENLRVIKIEPTTRSSLFDAYNNGDEDHQIMMKMTYERIA